MTALRSAIEESAENHYVVSIPEFKFIGHDDVEFGEVYQVNGNTSFITKEIDTTAMANDILNGSRKNEYVAANRGQLQTQAASFYSNIITAIDDTAVVEFEYL